ncbi:hypothetical protein BpHYR1_045823 [Brachionus plicatilis]|uniref:Uncharacterized protein n=1 Tax=Brachionus plicatilis TaxID=10195 RepID=A0A3M7P8K8_BRAPC|nr:hypothetical protein BpHYR1_045823 [Brachionus plicatilis]
MVANSQSHFIESGHYIRRNHKHASFVYINFFQELKYQWFKKIVFRFLAVKILHKNKMLDIVKTNRSIRRTVFLRSFGRSARRFFKFFKKPFILAVQNIDRPFKGCPANADTVTVSENFCRSISRISFYLKSILEEKYLIE